MTTKIATIEVQEDDTTVTPTEKPKLTLEERLKMFEPKKHGGEAMASRHMGLEF